MDLKERFLKYVSYDTQSSEESGTFPSTEKQKVLLDALRDYDKDKTLKAMMGEEFSSAYLKLKHQEWNSYCSHFSKWENENTLDI